MARAPSKTCPNLARLFDEAPTDLLASFLQSKAFKRLDWLNAYALDPGDVATLSSARAMLNAEKKVKLMPLETEAARVIMIAAPRGQFALGGLADAKLPTDARQAFLSQRDELARSLWAYCQQPALFDAAESALHLRLYRRFDRHYQTFLAEPSTQGGPDADSVAISSFLKAIGESLDRGEGYSIDRFEIPEDGDEPSAEMYLVFHPDQPTSAQEIDEEGRRSRFYFRPPGEAMIVYVPSTGRVHVRAATRALRHLVAEKFVTAALEQPLSQQPEDFRAYDLSRFFAGFDLDSPDFSDVTVLDQKVIRADVSIIDLATRLTLTAPIDSSFGRVFKRYGSLRAIFDDAIAVRLVEIAVRYRRVGGSAERTLDFTISDRNTSSLMSLDDPFEQALGHRLLRHWGVLRDGRAPRQTETLAAIPALLALWNRRDETVNGGWLRQRNANVGLLQELGFLVPAGWEGDDLIDDEDAVGPVVAEVVTAPEGLNVTVSEGQAAPGAPRGDYRRYRVREGWVEQHLQKTLADTLDVIAIERINPNLLRLGTLRIDANDVPVWLARGLDDEHIRAATDTDLRARSHTGIGLVLQAGQSFGSCLAANVLTPVLDHVDEAATEVAIAVASLKRVFRQDRVLAQGGLTVRLDRSGENAGTLFVPGAGSIDIVGENRLKVIQLLVERHNAGSPRMKTADMTKGIAGQSLANIFGKALWDKLKAGFIRSPASGLWEIAV